MGNRFRNTTGSPSSKYEHRPQGPEEMCLLEHQNPSKTGKTGCLNGKKNILQRKKINQNYFQTDFEYCFRGIFKN